MFLSFRFSGTFYSLALNSCKEVKGAFGRHCYLVGMIRYDKTGTYGLGSRSNFRNWKNMSRHCIAKIQLNMMLNSMIQTNADFFLLLN